jgi:hypothetical protein
MRIQQKLYPTMQSNKKRAIDWTSARALLEEVASFQGRLAVHVQAPGPS